MKDKKEILNNSNSKLKSKLKQVKDPELKKYYDSKWIIPKDKNFSDSNFPEDIQNFIKRVKMFEAKAK